MQFIRKFFTIPIKVYKIFISPFLPKACRFEPSCSDYASEAILKHGIIKGGILGFLRICRCNPFGNSGYDPVPEKFSLKINKNV
jgi:hypothetical protein